MCSATSLRENVECCLERSLKTPCIPLFAASMKRSLINSAQFNPTEVAACDNAVTCYEQGEALANLGNYAEALVYFNQSVAMQPNYDAAWVFRGVVLIHLGQYQEALLSCDRAIEICPTNAEAWTFRGVALHRLDRYAEAYASYDRAVGKGFISLWQRLRPQRAYSFWKALL